MSNNNQKERRTQQITLYITERQRDALRVQSIQLRQPMGQILYAYVEQILNRLPLPPTDGPTTPSNCT